MSDTRSSATRAGARVSDIRSSARLFRDCASAARRRPLACHAAWYSNGMKTTIDKAGRVVIPARIRERLGLKPGTEIEILVDDFSLRLVRAVPGTRLARRGKRLVARPIAKGEDRSRIDLVELIEEERNRWPG